MKKLLVGLVAVTVAMPSFAYYWGALSGSWWDSSRWLHGGPPPGKTSSDWVIFNFANQEDDVTVDLEGRDAEAYYLVVANEGVSDNDGPYSKSVRVKGDGATLTLAHQIGVAYRRELTFDNVHVIRNGAAQGDLSAFGTLAFVNGSSYEAQDGTPYIYMKNAGSKLVVDNSRVKSGAFSIVPDSTVIVRNGGSLDYGSCWGAAETFNAMDIRIVDGDIYSKTYAVYTTQMFPLRSGTLYCRAVGVAPTVAADARIRLGGTIAATNSVEMAVSITNSATIYGRGRVFAGKLSGPANATLKLDLASLDVGNNFGPGTDGTVEYLNDVKIGFWADTRTLISPQVFGGKTIFDTADVLTGAPRTVYVNWMTQGLRGGLFVCGGGKVNFQMSAYKDRYSVLGADTNSTFTVYGSAYYSTTRTHDLTLGPGARFELSDHYYRWLDATGKVTIDPAATLKFPHGRSTVSDFQPVFSSIDGDYPDFNLDVTVPSGCSLRRVGGCIYILNDSSLNEDYGCWRGDGTKNKEDGSVTMPDGLWSTASNWRSAQPNATFRARFAGAHMTVVTNDLANCLTPSLGAWRDTSGPFIIRGNRITLTDYGPGGVISTQFNKDNGPVCSAVWSQGKFPFIIEAPLYTEQEVFGVTAKDHTTDAASVALMGDVSAENATFNPCGDVIIGGTLTARDFMFSNSVSRTFNGENGIRTSVLTIRDGGLVDITAQTSAQSAAGTLWIAKGGTMKVNGDWNWNGTANSHVLEGTLEIDGSIGGDAVQGYFGAGTLKVGGAVTRFKVGNGVKIVPGEGDFTGVIEFAGDASVAPESDWSLPVNAEVSGLGAKLEIAGTGYTAVSTLPAGYDYDVVVSGKVAPERDLTIPHLEFKPGSTVGLCLEDGAVPVLTASNSVSVAGVKFAALTEATQAALRKTPVLRVAEGCQITGTPEGATDDWKFAVRPTSDGGSELRATIRHGLMVILR